MLGAGDKAQRAGIVSDLDEQIRKQEQEGFDLDAITEADLDEPPRAAALYDLDALDALIRRPELLPPGYAVEPLGNREYTLSMPGLSRSLRVTTLVSFFEDHPGSAELWSPGSPLFPPANPMAADSGPPDDRIQPLSMLLEPR